MSTPKSESVQHVPSPAAFTEGQLVLDRYRLQRRLGAGGMGVVYLAHDEHLERPVAVKRIAIESAGDADLRAHREAVASARLSHPGIVALYEAASDGEAVYLVSELVRGATLAQLERRGELSDRDVVQIGIVLCDALEHAHARGVIHRDVKPSNILCPEGDRSGGVAKLADLGVAQLAEGDALTRTGDIVGTLAYMAPEQARGRPLTGAADAYALGLVLYEALAGVNPVRGPNAAATARRVGMRVPPLQRSRPDLEPVLCRAIDAMLFADPRERALLADLRHGLRTALPRVDDEPGTIEAPSLDDHYDLEDATERRPLPVVTPERRPGPRRTRRDARSRDGLAPGDGDFTLGRSSQSELPMDRRSRSTDPMGLVARIAGAAGAAALVAAALGTIGPSAPVAPAAGAAGAALAVGLLPRLGWVACAAALVAWLAVDLPGAALLLGIAAVPVVLLLPLSGWAWSLPALPPALGAAALAGVWPAIAGQAGRWPVRAALGALGFWWLVLAELISGERLLLGAAGEAPPRDGWEGSVADTAADALWPVLESGLLVVALLWAVAAALLPLLVRGRSIVADLVAVAFWAAALAAGTQAIAQGLGVADPRGMVAGAVLSATVAVGARAWIGYADPVGARSANSRVRTR